MPSPEEWLLITTREIRDLLVEIRDNLKSTLSEAKINELLSIQLRAVKTARAQQAQHAMTCRICREAEAADQVVAPHNPVLWTDEQKRGN